MPKTMRGAPLARRVAGRLRRAMGHDELVVRVAALEQGLAALEGPRYPGGPVYLGDHRALVATRWGAKLVVDTRDSLLTPWLLLDGLWESHVTGWMQGVVRPGDTVVDVGANIGYFTVLAGHLVGKSGRVVAVEPHPDLAAILRRNIVINGQHQYVKVWEWAAWSESTQLSFHQRVHYGANSSVGRVAPEHLSELADREETVEVQGAPVDRMLEGVGPVDVLKVDVEGAEVHAFRGLEATVRANPGLSVMFEWAPEQLGQVGSRPDELVDLLMGYGLQFRLLEEDLAEIGRSRLLDLEYGNVVASRRPRRLPGE